MEYACPPKFLIQPTDTTLNHSIQIKPNLLNTRSTTLSRLHRRLLYIQLRFPNQNHARISHFRLTSSPFPLPQYVFAFDEYAK